MNKPPAAPIVQPAKKKPTKWLVILLAVMAGLFVLCMIISLINLSTPSGQATATAAEAYIQTETVAAIPTATLEPTLAPTLEPKANLIQSIRDVLGTSNRDEVQRINSIEIDSSVPPIISVSWAINMNLTDNMTILGAKLDVKEILQAIKESGFDFQSVNLTATYSMVDMYGNSTEKTVLTLVYSKDTINKINFDTVLTDNMYLLADSGNVIPQFNQ
jgi:hypothetical protein